MPYAGVEGGRSAAGAAQSARRSGRDATNFSTQIHRTDLVPASMTDVVVKDGRSATGAAQRARRGGRDATDFIFAHRILSGGAVLRCSRGSPLGSSIERGDGAPFDLLARQMLSEVAVLLCSRGSP